MTVIKQTILGTNPQSWVDFFGTLECPRITIVGTTIFVGDVYSFSVADTGNFSLTVNEESVEVPNNPLIDASGSFITVACDEGYVWLTIKSYSANNKTFMMFYEIVEDLHLFAYKFASGIRFADLGYLMDKDDEEDNLYYHSNRLSFATVTGFIKFTNDVLFQVGTPNVRVGIVPHFFACSTIAENQIVTFGMMDYYALTSNLLIPLDREVQEIPSEG